MRRSPDRSNPPPHSGAVNRTRSQRDLQLAVYGPASSRGYRRRSVPAAAPGHRPRACRGDRPRSGRGGSRASASSPRTTGSVAIVAQVTISAPRTAPPSSSRTCSVFLEILSHCALRRERSGSRSGTGRPGTPPHRLRAATVRRCRHRRSGSSRHRGRASRRAATGCRLAVFQLRQQVEIDDRRQRPVQVGIDRRRPVHRRLVQGRIARKDRRGLHQLPQPVDSRPRGSAAYLSCGKVNVSPISARRRACPASIASHSRQPVQLRLSASGPMIPHASCCRFVRAQQTLPSISRATQASGPSNRCVRHPASPRRPAMFLFCALSSVNRRRSGGTPVPASEKLVDPRVGLHDPKRDPEEMNSASNSPRKFEPALRKRVGIDPRNSTARTPAAIGPQAAPQYRESGPGPDHSGVSIFVQLSCPVAGSSTPAYAGFRFGQGMDPSPRNGRGPDRPARSFGVRLPPRRTARAAGLAEPAVRTCASG